MPPKREADDGPGASNAAKIPKYAHIPATGDEVERVKYRMFVGDFDEACDFMRNALTVRDSVITGHESTISQLEKEITKLQGRRDRPGELEELRNQNDYMRRDAAHARDEVRGKTELLIKVLDETKDLTKRIQAWKEATANLQSAGSCEHEGSDATAVDVGRHDCSHSPPSYLLDPEVAPRIVDHYARQVEQSASKIQSYITSYGPYALGDELDEP